MTEQEWEVQEMLRYSQWLTQSPITQFMFIPRKKPSRWWFFWRRLLSANG